MSSKVKQPEAFFTVSQVSRIAGVSVRTLHHYDSIGLLTPTRSQQNGYRYYTQSHLARLQQIIIYRNLDFTLDDIKRMFNDPDFDHHEALRAQRDMLIVRLNETQSMIKNVEATMSTLEGKQNLDILFEGLPTDKIERWQEMLAETESDVEFDKVLNYLGNLSEEESHQTRDDFDRWVVKYIEAMGLAPDSEEVQALMKEHFILQEDFLRKMWPDGEFEGIDYEIYMTLADAATSDPVTQEMYEHYHEGMAEHVKQAMLVYSSCLK